MTYLTIPHFELLTEQQAFDLSVKHTLAVGPSIDPGTSYCIYAGVGCAAAVFLAPSIASELDARDTCPTWTVLYINGEVPGTHHALVTALQHAHDRAARAARDRHYEQPESFLNTWLPMVANVARHQGLNMDVFAIH